jgi:hypothetical protein
MDTHTLTRSNNPFFFAGVSGLVGDCTASVTAEEGAPGWPDVGAAVPGTVEVVVVVLASKIP